MGLRTEEILKANISQGKDCTYFAIILPGNATLTVQSRPFVGLNTAVGLEVSRATGSPLVFSFASLLRFRF